MGICFVVYCVRNVKSLWILLYSFILKKNFMISYDGGFSASTRRHEPIEDRNLRIFFVISFGQPEVVKVLPNLLENLVAK